MWPLATAVDPAGRLRVGSLDLARLAERHGTPLYAYDAATIRAAYRDYVRAYRPFRPVRISYALKSCPLLGVAGLLAGEGADASAASLGEVLAARRSGYDPTRIQLHGNAKTEEELAGALRAKVGRIVIDGAEEIAALGRLMRRRRATQAVWLRVSPGIAADTHPHLRTGALDSKFGAPLATGDALAQARAIAATPGLRLVGIHAHIGTELHEAERYRELAGMLAGFARSLRETLGVRITEIGAGGGLKIPLRAGDHVLGLCAYASALGSALRGADAGKTTLYLEPGRSLVGRAGVALYRVVGTKRVAGVRTFVSVDGGMGDNIRPALYGAEYTAVLAERAAAPPEEEVAIAGRYCESGDLLIRSVALPTPRAGEVLAVPGAGAYAVAMASNYNHFPRPAVVLLDRGRARLIRKREKHADIWRLERR
ncbi:MAG: diaminopimelate decarboxylase [Chloroflexi bacterium]|nr:diaminopimelate decarboxylase [Chloroflexota bacterium]